MDSPFFATADKAYGAVPLAMVVSQLMIVTLGGGVMKARKECGVEYPNLYASVVKDKDGNLLTNAKSPELAEKFNSIQRGHQNTLEAHYATMALTAVLGQAYPLFAAGSLISYSIGARFFAKNYSKGGPKHRNDGMALIKYAGMLSLLGGNLAIAFKILSK
mmetsp:Transcript_6992/g.12924  ORF Transcript_6992/g.12924 Transcript_6992/m.12924 type:complete len:161 (-) Transcript_6992:80-562(-)